MINTTEVTARYIDSDNVESDCLDLTFYNEGTKTCFINSFPLVTGASKVVSCNNGEILRGKYQITFAAGAGTQSVFVLRRIYQNN